LVRRIQNGPQGADGTLQHAGESHVELELVLLQPLTCLLGLAKTLFGEIHISPSSKSVHGWLVPDALAMANQNNFVLRLCHSALEKVVSNSVQCTIESSLRNVMRKSGSQNLVNRAGRLGTNLLTCAIQAKD
jgi:hypothetical protein